MGANVAGRLLEHYVDKSRDLPWRSPPGLAPPDSYRVWLSEVMLQQTTVAAVAPRFERFTARWPTVEALAAAPDEEVLGEWAGLGYYARARNLIACAREVVRKGGFPDTEAELRRLPGIGDYTAAAIAAIAFGKRAVVVDSNVERVAARLFALSEPTRIALRHAVDSITPDKNAGDFAQAIMDLGATICRPREPNCGVCPLTADCAAFATGSPQSFPAARARKARPIRYGIACWTERDGAVFLVRRPARGLLGGMPALPGPEWTAGELSSDRPALAHVRHVFTHFALELTVVESDEPKGNGWWQPLASLSQSGLPTLYRRAAEAILSTRVDLAA
jgi:A/G-specific adenine glycosylase